MRSGTKLVAIGAALLTIGLAVKLISSSGRSKQQPAVADQTVIANLGEYRYADLGLVLRTTVDSDGLVQYSLQDNSGRELVHSTERASAYSRWQIVVDSSRRLWFYSGDVGFFVWDGTGDSTRHLPTELRAAVPDRLKPNLKK